MPRPLDGPRLAPASGTARSLVVFVHGYGANGDDLIALGQMWQAALPDTVFVSPHAPEECAANPFGGRQWFPLTLRDEQELVDGLAQAGPDLDAFLDAELERHGLGPEALALVGFSQGTMMALHVGLRRAGGLAALVGYSGVLANAAALAGEIAARPPVLLVHGAQDELIPAQALAHTRDALQRVDVPVEAHLREGLGHGIDEEGLRLGAGFLARHLAGAG
ncbi:alpha/beta hydrolase [Dichotomicrobium thermohalophilum]|uniref:Phospholipase/carboxylesterase n=1 Tax=Dichotomicrobium thermohalophilum TaxID=933063 RepID=A0A397Q5E4_9HYPH|nr:dienelactone hydrolase family protein [Dichotomicrobium thermohalophilum]RIA56173.1 phospholipase/carboxylesterase [Dichotomicrobium thermohalophilum]